MNTRSSFLSAALLFSLFFSNAYAGAPASSELDKANTLFSQKNYSAALPLYKKIAADDAAKDGASGYVLARIGDCSYKLGDYKGAIDAYRSALPVQKRPEQAATQYWIGFSTLLLNKPADAVAEFLKVAERYPESGMWVSTSYYWAAKASERLGNKEQAAAFYKKAAGKGKSDQGRFALKQAEAAKAGK